MAKKKKKLSPKVKAKRREKARARKTKKQRTDYRQGGRVGFLAGGGNDMSMGGSEDIDIEINPENLEYAHDPYAGSSIFKDRREWTPVNRHTQWNLDPSLQTYNYDQAIASGMKPVTPVTSNDPNTGMFGGQIGPKIKEWWRKDDQGGNVLYNAVKNTWEKAEDIINPFDGSYPIADLVQKTGQTLIPGGENPLADWFKKKSTEVPVDNNTPQVNTPTENKTPINVNAPADNKPIAYAPLPSPTIEQQQAQDLSVQQQILPEQSRPVSVPTQSPEVLTPKIIDESDDVQDDTDDANKGWGTEHGYNNAEEAIQSGNFIYDTQAGVWVLKSTSTDTDETEEKTYPENLPEGARFAYDVARGQQQISPDAVKLGGVPDMTQTTMASLTPEQQAEATKATVNLYKKDASGNIITDETGAPIPVSATATADDATIAQKITDVKGSTYDEIEKILTAPTVTAAQSTFNEQHKAAIQEIIGVKKADTVSINEQEANKALAQDLSGTLSDGAKSQAVSISGADLSRVLRAKKQLRNAGLAENIITELGNNPDDLENRLDEFTEAERGVVAGLPQEALVSNQLDTLLTGIDNGEVPTWAQPAVAAVNQIMAERGLDTSTVGRDNLFNAIIQSAVPLAQQNAQAIQNSFAQTKELESRLTIRQAELNQQTALENANKTFQMDMANFNEDQTRNLANSKFLQTVELTNASMEQQAAVQEAANLANLDLATLSTRERLAVSNAKNFLQLDMANLTNRQQSEVLSDQIEMQKLLSNQSAENARLQFNAQSENQVNTFMANLANQIEINNAQRMDALSQFNATQENAALARREGIEADMAKINAQLLTQVDQFNAQQDFERNKWNATNQAMIEQSNVEWRRRANTIDTAAQNQINMQNAMNSFKLSGASLSNYWQQLRDEAAYDFKSVENAENRLAQILSTAIANEGTIAEKSGWDEQVAEFKSVYELWFGD